jgi:3-methyladenine DNA glycosylase AlkD
MLEGLIKDLNQVANSKKAKILARFFKTGKGEYGAGDKFLGVMVPIQRKIAKKYLQLRITDLEKLLISKIHEHRLTALFILIDQYQKADDRQKKEIISFYLRMARVGRINSWDLVDLSAPKILGDFLLDKKKDTLYNLIKSKNLWVRRVAVLSTFTFIRESKFNDSLKIAQTLISDPEDLIHKAVGWMLREIGKKDFKLEMKFLDRWAGIMPRTMLRYAIEKFNQSDRYRFLNLRNKK